MVKRVGSQGRGRAWQVRPRWRITRADDIALGPGKADLLEAIQRAHAISRAATNLGMSYRRAWLLVAEMNASFREPLVRTSPWRGEGASLTAEGRRVLSLYRQIETRSLKSCSDSIRSLTALLRRTPKTRRGGTHH